MRKDKSNPSSQGERLTRRQAIQRVSLILGGTALIGQARLLETLSGQGTASEATRLSANQIALLDEIAETILPETNTPGARAAGVGPFMALMVAESYSPEERRTFTQGLATLDQECVSLHRQPFLEASSAQRLSLLERLDREQFEKMQGAQDGEPVHYFRMMKELALLGYFTSEIGYTKVLRYRETPGQFQPCVPYSSGDKAWANHA